LEQDAMSEHNHKLNSNEPAPAFTPALRKQIESFLTRYETKRSAILPALHAIQDELGWIADEHVEILDKEFGLHRVQVREALTFYSAYRQKKPRPYHIQFCNNIVCCMLGANEVIDKIKGHIKKFEEKGKESPFGVEGVPCMCVCDGAPAMLVNKDRHLKVTKENIDSILEKYASLKSGV